MNALSPWAISASAELADAKKTLFDKSSENFAFQVFQTSDSVWIQTIMPNGGSVAFRVAYSPGGLLAPIESSENGEGIDLLLNSVYGKQKVGISLALETSDSVLRYTTTLTPAKDLLLSYWPKDILFTGKNDNPENTAGQIHASQFGTRTGFIYMSQTRPKSATLLYLQNLTALSAYCDQTETSLADTVGGEWPELGFSLPPSKKPLKAGKEVVISDAFVAFHDEVPDQESQVMRLYLNLLARIYILQPRPQTSYHHWPEILDAGLKDLINSPGCWWQGTNISTLM
jgi:hypothetical protein